MRSLRSKRALVPLTLPDPHCARAKNMIPRFGPLGSGAAQKNRRCDETAQRKEGSGASSAATLM